MLFIWNVLYQHLYTLPYYSFADDILVVWSGFYLLAVYSKERQIPKQLYHLRILIILYIVTIVISILVNQVPVVIAIKGSLDIIKPWILLLFFFQLYDDNYNIYVKNILGWAAIIGFGNLIVLIILRKSIGVSYEGDIAVGISGDAHVAGEYLFILCIYLYYHLIEKRRYYVIPIIVAAIYGFFVTGVKQLTVFVFIFPILIIFISAKKKIFHIVLVGVLFIAIILNFNRFTDFFLPIHQFSIIEQSAENYYALVDYIALSELIEYGFNEMDNYIFGAGPGMYGSATAIEHGTYFYTKYLQRLEHPLWTGTILSPQNQILIVLSEVGVIGIVVFTFLIVAIIVFAMKFDKKTHKDNILFGYYYIGILSHIVGRMFVLDTFTMNQSLLYLLYLMPVILINDYKTN